MFHKTRLVISNRFELSNNSTCRSFNNSQSQINFIMRLQRKCVDTNLSWTNLEYQLQWASKPHDIAVQYITATQHKLNQRGSNVRLT